MNLTARPFEEFIGSRDLTHWPTPAGRFLARRIVGFSRWTTSTFVLIVTALVGLGLAVGLAAVAAEIYEMVTNGDGVAGFDQPVLDAFIAMRTPGLNSVVNVFTTTGGPVWMPVIAIIVTALIARWQRSWTPVFLMVAAVAGSLTMTIVGKAVIGRNRPPMAEAVPPYESSNSFPSGHSLNSLVIAAVVVYLLLARLTSRLAEALVVAAGVVYVVAMGISRVYLGHHWLTDVLVAWVLGVAWVGLLVTAHRLALTHQRYRRELAELTAGSPDAVGTAPRPEPPHP